MSEVAYNAMMAKADIESIENDATAVGRAGRMHAGQFYRRIVEQYGEEIAGLAYEALNCKHVDFAIANLECWQALVKLQNANPELHQIVVSKIAWEESGPADFGPFGNNFGE